MKQLAKVKPPENYYLHFKVKKDSLNSDKFGKNLNYPADAVWAELDTHRQAAYAALDDLTVMSAAFASLANDIDWNPLKAFLKNGLSDALEYGYRCLKGDEFERGRLTDQHEGPAELSAAAEAVNSLQEKYKEDFEGQPAMLAFLLHGHQKIRTLFLPLGQLR
jgi:hypothetical protein